MERLFFTLFSGFSKKYTTYVDPCYVFSHSGDLCYII